MLGEERGGCPPRKENGAGVDGGGRYGWEDGKDLGRDGGEVDGEMEGEGREGRRAGLSVLAGRSSLDDVAAGRGTCWSCVKTK